MTNFEKLKKKNHNLSVSFKTEQKVEHFFNLGKDKTNPILNGQNPYHLVLFEEATLIFTVNGLPRSFKEAIEIKKKKNI